MRARVCVAASVAILVVAAEARAQPFLMSFPVNERELVTEGENPYFILRPGYQLTLAGREGLKPVQLVITVLPETVTVGGVETRVVEERETKGGELVEVSRNFLAIHPFTKDLYYFGEDVDIYKHGKVESHEGAWRHGTKDARFGLMLPGRPARGMRHYQEIAPGVAMDRMEIVSVDQHCQTVAGVFERCLKAVETTPIERKAKDVKLYAPGVGLVEDGPLKLVSRRLPDSMR